jgi:multiple sugar transport system permease protein
MVTIPQEYLDAAKVDGAGEWGTLLRVVIPMARPGIAATSLFMFFFCWNDYYGPYLFTSENDKNWTLSFALASFRGLHNVEWNYVMAAAVITVVPVMVLFFFAQKAFVQGVTLTGVKG